jgi:Protein of unknown function (DUF2442)
MNTPKILSVQPLENKRLLVKFVNSVEKIYDCQPLIEKYEPFKPLENEVFFKQVRADSGGYGISWNDNVDLSEYELWTNAVEVVRT